MTPEQKAKELLRSFSFIEYDQEQGTKLNNPTLKAAARQCALICVDEIINRKYQFLSFDEMKKEIDYWQQVKEYLKEDKQ